MIATERVYRTADGRYVSEGDPAAAFLVCGIGGELPDDYQAAPAVGEEPAEKVEPADVTEKVEAEPTPKKSKKG